jgi:pSer/pThr/pTyr-binding forkhead associated (FHA) protein
VAVAQLIVQDAEQTYLVEVKPGETLRIGRAHDCELPVSTERASRGHAEIRSGDAGVCVADLGSTNGTLLNGAPLDGERPLADGDVIDVGGSTILYRISPSA